MGPLSETATAPTVAAVVAEFTKLILRKVTPLTPLVLMLKGMDGDKMVAWFADQSATAEAVAPTRVTIRKNDISFDAPSFVLAENDAG